jgi:hypothetical protein
MKNKLRYSTQWFAFLSGGSGSMGIKVAWFDYSTAACAPLLLPLCDLPA